MERQVAEPRRMKPVSSETRLILEVACGSSVSLGLTKIPYTDNSIQNKRRSPILTHIPRPSVVYPHSRMTHTLDSPAFRPGIMPSMINDTPSICDSLYCMYSARLSKGTSKSPESICGAHLMHRVLFYVDMRTNDPTCIPGRGVKL